MARILLIDDDNLFRATLHLTLADFGHTVIEARDGKEGMKLLPDARADLVITDLVMPEMEGFEVLTEVRKTHPPMKIIVVSGGVQGDTRNFLRMAEHLGAGKVLAKPFTSEALLAAVNELLSRPTPIPPDDEPSRV